ncbi:hypothetical protein RSAG8_09984, partial [Rhizoctonia solani AG-8 WAC10335]
MFASYQAHCGRIFKRPILTRNHSSFHPRLQFVVPQPQDNAERKPDPGEGTASKQKAKGK